MKKLIGEANINLNGVKKGERKFRIKVKYY